MINFWLWELRWQILNYREKKESLSPLCYNINDIVGISGTAFKSQGKNFCFTPAIVKSFALSLIICSNIKSSYVKSSSIYIASFKILRIVPHQRDLHIVWIAWLINQFVDWWRFTHYRQCFSEWAMRSIRRRCTVRFISQAYVSGGSLRSKGLHKGLPAQIENYVNIISDVRVHKLKKKLKDFIFVFIFNWHSLRTNEVCGIDIKLNEWRVCIKVVRLGLPYTSI